MQLDWSQGALREGLCCYRSGKFFAAHEHWESIWLAAKEPEKTFLQGLIQVAAAFHHYQRGNRAGTASLLQAALRRLERYPGVFGGIAVDPLREEIRAWLAALQSGAADTPPAFPALRGGG
jgi:predicted metal-dependent hydrolase